MGEVFTEGDRAAAFAPQCPVAHATVTLAAQTVQQARRVGFVQGITLGVGWHIGTRILLWPQGQAFAVAHGSGEQGRLLLAKALSVHT